LIGAPNAGKSTLLNRILGQKISITSSKPQTTRNRILGVRHYDQGQMVFLDTPGIHHAHSKLNQRMVSTATSTLSEVDAILWVLDASTPSYADSERLIAHLLHTSPAPVILCANKADLVSEETLQGSIGRVKPGQSFHRILPVSALRGTGIKPLLDEIERLLPEGPPYFPPDMVTDLPERFLAAEIIREKVIRLCSQEIPHAVAVTVDSFKEKEAKEMVVIQATIHLERDSQKGILIGKEGKMLKRIGSSSRKDLEALLGVQVYLELWVRVQRDWRKKDRAIQDFGY